jgi:DNA-directed RNA polymerase I, II, and III subunit RPABC2
MEELRQSSKLIHPEVLSIDRTDIDTKDRTTLPYYSKYEYTCLLGTRAQQLAEGARPLVSTDGLNTSDPQFIWKLAKKEILEQKLPFIIHRRLPNGKSEFWSTMELFIIW